MNQILVFVFDGLQISQVSHGLMPNLATFADDGVRFENHHSVFPTVTRVNVASITTGRYPGGHGIAGNNFLDRSFNPGRILPALRPELGELFDLERDPNEFDNLWTNPDYKEIRFQLMQKNFDALAFAVDTGSPRVSGF